MQSLFQALTYSKLACYVYENFITISDAAEKAVISVAVVVQTSARKRGS